MFFVCLFVFPSFPSWTTSEPSWCRQWRKPTRSTPSPVELTVSWSWRDPCSSRPIWELCPSSTTKQSWATPWRVAKSASEFCFPLGISSCYTAMDKLQCKVCLVCLYINTRHVHTSWSWCHWQVIGLQEVNVGQHSVACWLICLVASSVAFHQRAANTSAKHCNIWRIFLQNKLKIN